MDSCALHLPGETEMRSGHLNTSIWEEAPGEAMRSLHTWPPVGSSAHAPRSSALNSSRPWCTGNVRNSLQPPASTQETRCRSVDVTPPVATGALRQCAGLSAKTRARAALA